MAPDKPLERLKTKTTIECLWPHILSLMKKKPVYAYEIRKLLQEKSGFTVGQVTAYMVLYKLENQGYVETEWRIVNQRQRKYYKTTQKGRKALDEAVKYLKETAKKL